MTTSTTVDCINIDNLLIRGFNSSKRFPILTAYTRDYIPMNRSYIPTPEVARWWPHLQELEDKLIPLQDYEVGLLIDYNCPQAIPPISMKLGEAPGPYAVETELRWNIGRRVQGVEEDEEHFTHRIKVKEGIFLPKIIWILESDFINVKGDEDISMLSQNELKFTNILHEGIHKDAKGFYEMP
ncbi:hypothetical protein LSH36_657g02052 [Paralvinella palmiformis]|uniref:Uncharacterized protein n=1 Tax=Paralvinella palmiformis TaxID=53620 RepID=A0AAD9J329_9ANNE|nr:hypothetical protein LSH36_657g02052 [Paralvinella palmiformis]